MGNQTIRFQNHSELLTVDWGRAECESGEGYYFSLWIGSLPTYSSRDFISHVEHDDNLLPWSALQIVLWHVLT